MTERAEWAAQKEADLQRWADDGGFTPDPEVGESPPAARNPWAAVAVGLGFVLGWLTGRR